MSAPTPLARHLAARIAAEGPLTLADYMAECLMNPHHGYYATRDPLGAAGDFTTAPEISQMFGELIGLCLAQAWLDQGSPERIVLAELGPGRGTLMADLLRAARAVPGFARAAEVWLVETSPALRRVQADTLAGHTDAVIRWADGLAQAPEAPLYLVANEFLDALPIRQFRRAGDGWRETMVGLAPDGETLQPGAGPLTRFDALAHRLEDTAEGDIVETCAPATAVAAEIGRRIAAHGGAALLIDYGDWRSLGDTFQALRDHRTADPFAAPGLADLTAHVDFEPLAQAAAPAAHSRLTPQGMFLERLGIAQRAERLAQGLSGDALAGHVAAHRRLTHPAEMGTLFKVLALHPEDCPPPPGLEPARPDR